MIWRHLLLRRGLLAVTSVIIMAGGSIRLGSGFGMAFAATERSAPAPSEAQRCAAIQVDIAKALVQRETAVTAKETILSAKEAAIAKAETSLTSRLKALEEGEKHLRDRITQADGAAERDLAQLTEIYQTMKPKEAARLFAGMDPQFAAGFIGRMRSAEAASILAGMEPESAYAISALLAARNAETTRP